MIAHEYCQIIALNSVSFIFPWRKFTILDVISLSLFLSFFSLVLISDGLLLHAIFSDHSKRGRSPREDEACLKRVKSTNESAYVICTHFFLQLLQEQNRCLICMQQKKDLLIDGWQDDSVANFHSNILDIRKKLKDHRHSCYVQGIFRYWGWNSKWQDRINSMTVYYCFSPSRVTLPLSKHLQSKIIASEATGGFVINDGI